MIFYIGNDKLKGFITNVDADIQFCEGIEDCDKVVITTDTPAAVEAVKIAAEKNIPLLAVLDGVKSLIKAFGGEVCPAKCNEGAQEWAVIDATSPVYILLESVIKVCRGGAFTIVEETKPTALDCMSRCETGEIIAFRNFTDADGDGTVIASAPKEYGNIYGINYDLSSPLTPDGKQIMTNFINL